MLNINTKQFSIITFLIIFIFFAPHILTTSVAQKREESGVLNIETLLGEPASASGGNFE